MANNGGDGMSTKPETTTTAQVAAALPVPAPISQLASLSGLGNVGLLIGAVALMWARIDAIESRFDDIDIRIDNMTQQMAKLSTSIEVMMVQQVTVESFVDLERRVTVIESKL